MIANSTQIKKGLINAAILKIIYIFSLLAHGDAELKILHVLYFDSIRKRMSIIVKHPKTNEIILYTKGADSAIFERLAPMYKGKFLILQFSIGHYFKFSLVCHKLCSGIDF